MSKTPSLPSPSTPPIPPAIRPEQLAAHRKSVDLSCWDSRAAQRVAQDLFQQIDHLTAKLAAAQTYTPRAIERFDVEEDQMVERPLGYLVRYSDHLDALNQVHTAYNLTRDILEDTTRELAQCRSDLGETAPL